MLHDRKLSWGGRAPSESINQVHSSPEMLSEDTVGHHAEIDQVRKPWRVCIFRSLCIGVGH